MRCEGLNYKRVDCDRLVSKNETYCKTHKYFEDFSDSEIDGVRNNTNIFKVCGRCKRWHNYKLAHCEKCTNASKADKLKVKIEHDKNKCNGIDRNKEPCRNSGTIDGIGTGVKFCKFHEYMKVYTKDMMDNLTICSGCRKNYYMPNQKMCGSCKGRKNDVNIDKKELPKMQISKMYIQVY